MYKLVLIDDELLEIRWFENVLKKLTGRIEIISFTNSVSALAYIKHNKTDIVLTDIHMPNMDGISLIKEIRKEKKEIKIIIVSGFSEFEYAKAAMRYDVKHYLVKPVVKSQLKEVLDDTLNELDEYSIQQRELNNDNHNKFLYDICMGWYETPEELKEAFEKSQFPFDIEKAYGSVININVKNMPSEYALRYEKGILNVLESICNNYVCASYNKHSEFICFIFENKNIDAEYIEKAFEDILDLDISVQILDVFSSLEDIDGKKIYSPETRMEMFVSKIIADDNILNRNIIRRIIQDLNEREVNIVNKRIFYEEFSDRQREMIEKIGKDINVQFIPGRKSPADEAKEYICKNYDKKITLEKVARSVHMNASYFSRYFKNKVGMGFHEYLSQCRIDKVKALILTDKTMEQIATECGFSDVRTMRRNFKDSEGVTMSEYKEKYKL